MAEGCRSGLTGVTGNHVCPKGHPGFESLPFRHFSNWSFGRRLPAKIDKSFYSKEYRKVVEQLKKARHEVCLKQTEVAEKTQ